MFLVRDSKGQVFNKLKEPAVILDTKEERVLKNGEYEDMLKYFNIMCKKYREAGFDFMVNDLAVMHLPKDQGEIDKVFSMHNYIGVIYKKIKD